MPVTGPESITVPGALAAWNDLLVKYGTISLAEALAPAIKLAEEGFPLTPVIANDWLITGDVLKKDEGGRATYLVGDKFPVTGDWITNRDLGATFRTIAKEGVGAFYGGALGARIAKRVQDLGGYITGADLAAHRSGLSCEPSVTRWWV